MLTDAKIANLIYLTNNIVQIDLIPEHYINYQAGQFLKILLPEDALSYSIANCPGLDKYYELHIRVNSQNFLNQQLIDLFHKNSKLTIELPFGKCYVNKLDSSKPTLFIAIGTGIAPLKSMLQQLIVNKDLRNFELYWGVRSKQELYLHQNLSLLAEEIANFKYFPLVLDNDSALINLLLKNHLYDLKIWQVVLAGPFDLIYIMRDILVCHGLEFCNLFADAFSFEK